MSLAADRKRIKVTRYKELQNELSLVNSSAEFILYRGTNLYDATPDYENTPDELKLVGGWYQPLSMEFRTDLKPPSPKIKVKVVEQQLEPLLCKKNMMTVVGGVRCLEENTLVMTPSGSVPIKELKPGDYVIGYNVDGSTSPTKVLNVFDQGKKETVEYESVRCTLNHKFLVNKKIKRVSELDHNPIIKSQHCYDIEVDNDTHLFLLANGMISHNSGKSRVAFFRIMMKVIKKPGCTVVYLLPSMKKKHIVLDQLNFYMPHMLKSSNNSDFIYEFTNGSTLKLFTLAGTAQGTINEGILGGAMDLLVIEEARELKDFNLALQAAHTRIATTNGDICVVSSPESNHFLEEVVVNDYYGTDMAIFRLNSLKNILGKTDPVDPNKWFRQAKRIYPKNFYDCNILGKFVSTIENDAYEFKKDKHVIDRIPGVDVTAQFWQSEYFASLDPHYRPGKTIPNPYSNMPLLVGMDFGFGQTTAVVFKITMDNNSPFVSQHAIDFGNWHLTAIKELKQNYTNTVKFINEVLIPGLGCSPKNVAIICDPAGNKPSESDGISSVRHLKNKGFTVYCHDRHPERSACINAVNMRFKMNLLHSLPSCKYLIECLEKFRSGGRAQNQLSSDQYSHGLDCLKYVVQYLSPYQDLLKPENLKHLKSLGDTYLREAFDPNED